MSPRRVHLLFLLTACWIPFLHFQFNQLFNQSDYNQVTTTPLAKSLDFKSSVIQELFMSTEVKKRKITSDGSGDGFDDIDSNHLDDVNPNQEKNGASSKILQDQQEDEDSEEDLDEDEGTDSEDGDEDLEGDNQMDGEDPTKETAKVEYESPDAIKFEDGDLDHKKPKINRIKLFKNAKNKSKRLIIILEKANLEIVKVGKNFELITCDEHMKQIRQFKKDPAFCRPDITHQVRMAIVSSLASTNDNTNQQCLLMLFDSPLNRAGLLQVYIHTQNNILIEINPQTRFPRTFKRFANLMVQLLYKMCIKSSNGPQKLLRVIKNPVTSHLPVGCKKIGTSFQSEKLVHPKELVPEDDSPVVIVIGAMAHGPADTDFVEETVSISQYPLSAALACTKICSAFEETWGIH